MSQMKSIGKPFFPEWLTLLFLTVFILALFGIFALVALVIFALISPILGIWLIVKFCIRRFGRKQRAGLTW